MTSTHQRRSMNFPDFPPASRPSHIHPSNDHRLFRLGDDLGQALSRRLAEFQASPRRPVDARNAILWWCSDVSDHLSQSSRLDVVDDELAQADAETHADFCAWLSCEWNSTASLIELAWRLHCHPTLISALDWLFDQADTPSRPRRKSVARQI